MSLISNYSEVISYISALKKSNFKGLSIVKLRENLDRSFETTKREIQINYKNEDFNNSFFAICAWIDEVILCSSWKEKTEWSKAMLQQSFFGTTEAGEIFFDKLSSLPSNNVEVLEIYLYCLKLGFKGMYYKPGDVSILHEKIQNIYKLVVDEYEGEFDKPLSKCVLTPLSKDNKKDKEVKKQKKIKLRRLGLWLIPLAPFVIVSVIFNIIMMFYF